MFNGGHNFASSQEGEPSISCEYDKIDWQSKDYVLNYMKRRGFQSARR